MSESDHPQTTFEGRLLQRDPDAYLNDDGHVVVKRTGIKYQDGQAMSTTYEQDLTVLFQDAPRKTGHVDHLVIEAELYAENGEAGNPAVPIDDRTEREAREQIEAKGLTPAWEADA